MKTYLVSVRSRGTLALPADLRRRLHLDVPESQVRLIDHGNGRVELVPVVPVSRMRGFLRGIDTDVPREGDRL